MTKIILLFILTSSAFSQGYWDYRGDSWQYISTQNAPEISAQKKDDPTAGGAINTNKHKLYYSSSITQPKYVDGKRYNELIKRNVTEPEFQIESPQMLYVNQKCSGWVPAQRYSLAPLNKFLPMDFQLTSITIPSTFKTPEPNGNNLMMIAFMFLLFIRNLNRNKYRILTRENRQ